MTNEERQLLFQDLCGRLWCGVKVAYAEEICDLDTICCDSDILLKGKDGYIPNIVDGLFTSIDKINPYLRPMSSMTKEEMDEFEKIDLECDLMPLFDYVSIAHYRIFDWLNKHHFDYRGLIPMGLALEAPKDMYDIK